MNRSLNRHLTRQDVIKNGSIYTNPEIVELVFNYVQPFIDKNSVIGDFGAGYGAFLEKFQNKGKRCFATEFDSNSYSILTNDFPKIDIFKENSLTNASRSKYGLKEENELIVVGNPPYNDVTSQYKKGQKGNFEVDEDLRSRDLGASFLKLYDKLEARIVCILHPLAYLIKKNNFASLKAFKDNYKLHKATIFSSKEFVGIKKNSAEFPVVAALYLKDDNGMAFDYIQNFEFDIYQSNKIFKLNEISTIDGEVQKYPKKGHCKGLQFYTLRDMNALLRNATFVENRSTNAIEINDKNLYQYAWLMFLKDNFKPKSNRFLYGNLSPLYPKKVTEGEFQREVVSYAFNNNALVNRYYDRSKIESLYGAVSTDYTQINLEMDKLNNYFA